MRPQLFGLASTGVWQSVNSGRVGTAALYPVDYPIRLASRKIGGGWHLTQNFDAILRPPDNDELAGSFRSLLRYEFAHDLNIVHGRPPCK